MGKIISLGCDHRGFELAKFVQEYIISLGYNCNFRGTYSSEDRVDYVDFAEKVAEDIQKNLCEFGILICGSGIGVSVAANKFNGVYAGLSANAWMAEHGRKFDHINVLCLSSEKTTTTEAKLIIDAFLNAVPEGGRYAERVEKIKQIESRKVR